VVRVDFDTHSHELPARLVVVEQRGSPAPTGSPPRMRLEKPPRTPNLPEAPIAAPITVNSRRETDESYEGVISREGDLQSVNCPDDIQWIIQRFNRGQWRNKSFHRSRQSLINRYGQLEIILSLPEHRWLCRGDPALQGLWTYPEQTDRTASPVLHGHAQPLALLAEAA
jgi:hypothetical protein